MGGRYIFHVDTFSRVYFLLRVNIILAGYAHLPYNTKSNNWKIIMNIDLKKPLSLTRTFLKTTTSAAALVAISFLAFQPQAFAAALEYAGPGFEQLTFPVPNPTTRLGVAYTNTSDSSPNGFTETWDGTNAAAPWSGVGTEIVGTGIRPTSENSGSGGYDFSGLTNNGGQLPSGTFFNLSDLDAGSGAESFTIRAFDLLGDVLTDGWLDDAVSATTGQGSVLSQTNMPQYVWDSGSGTYTFDGSNIPGNPAILVQLITNQQIATIEYTKTDFHAFAFMAPAEVPVPAAAWLFGSGLLGLAGIAKRKKA